MAAGIIRALLADLPIVGRTMKLLVALVFPAALLGASPVGTADMVSDETRACEPPQVVLKRPGVTLPPNATYQNNDAPPLRFRGDRSVRVQFATPDEVERLCGVTKPICGYRLMACARGDRIIMPNPCASNSIVEPYGKMLCHELAHTSGWPAWHGD